MKLLVVGSRSIKEFDLSPYISSEVDTIISGGADGIDGLAERYADSHRLSKYIIRPRYDLYGRAAPLQRNRKMVDIMIIECRKGEQAFSRLINQQGKKQFSAFCNYINATEIDKFPFEIC